MKSKKYIIGVAVFFVLSIFITIYFFHDDDDSDIEIIEVNDIVESIKSNWGMITDDNLPGKEYQLDYVILDQDDNFITATKVGLNTDLNSIIKNKDLILYIVENETVVGKVIFYNNSKLEMIKYRKEIFFVSLTTLSIFFLTAIAYSFYLDKSVINPFRKLKEFSHQISMGNLDIPLKMDKNNWFGSFTESFDIMRTEIYKARENERRANQSKKELVASLSHDIKTPVASIQSVCELMSIKSDNANEKAYLEIIHSKAEQINTLITNLFNATLEELQELKVHVTEESSKILLDIIKKSDYYKKTQINAIPECLILVDKIRLEQVIDNIISNSYKYAGTSIEVKAKIIDDYLEIGIKDYGVSFDKTEIPLLKNKYYRGKNAGEKNGTGLGLYISNYFIEKMSGELSIFYEDGFCVKLKLLIV
ncbi:MAG: HAMP domain-containing sensor histidine kinase [Bacilli bacterium]|nr:HAMP domain-containing sensor histidine kinase [Bacilli bacterium]